MRLPTDEELAQMSTKILCNDIGLDTDNMSDAQLHDNIKQATRERSLAFWHDHATILGHGYLLVTVSVMYSASCFKRNTCQAVIEEPEIHMIALSSSSAEDQVAYECLEELNEVLYSSNEVPVKDVARFFIQHKISKEALATTNVVGVVFAVPW